MTLQDDEDFIKNLPPASQFTQRLQTLQQQLPSILADFQKAYILYNTTPGSQEYQINYQNSKTHLNSINSQLFTLSNDVQSNLDQINSKLFALDVLIKQERDKNTKLKRELGIVEHKKNAATEMILNYKEIYQSKYLRNWALFFSIFVVIGIISKIYGNKLPKVSKLAASKFPVSKFPVTNLPPPAPAHK